MKILSPFLFLFGFLLAESSPMLRKAPSGTVSIPGMRNTFIDKTEVTNRDYHRYLELLAQVDSSLYQVALPDRGVWFMAYESDFLTAEKRYESYPVVGVSYEQAMRYCQWRSQYVSEREGRDIHYRLPDLKAYRLCLKPEYHNRVAEGLYSTQLGFRNLLGLCDNAAEMTAETGVAIGGSQSDECLSTYRFAAPEPELGFRCVAEIQ